MSLMPANEPMLSTYMRIPVYKDHRYCTYPQQTLLLHVRGSDNSKGIVSLQYKTQNAAKRNDLRGVLIPCNFLVLALSRLHL